MIGLRPDEAEKTRLLAAILGWAVEPLHTSARVRSWVGRFPDAFGTGDPAMPWPVPGMDDVMLVDGGLSDRGSGDGNAPHGNGAQDWHCVRDRHGTQDRYGKQNWPSWEAHADQRADAPRLVLQQTGNVIRVEASDADLADQLARLGLDRLVLPVGLSVLEDLFTFAG